MAKPEAQARTNIDQALQQAGWTVQHKDEVNLSASQGVAVREFPLRRGYGFADYLLFIDGQAVGAVEAKPEGSTLTGVELQSQKYSEGLPTELPARLWPLRFLYESTGIETRFTNRLDPHPRSRAVFSFHRPGTLASWLDPTLAAVQTASPELARIAQAHGLHGVPLPLRARLQHMPPLQDPHLWPAQRTAIANLEGSLADDRPRALIQMTMGSGKTVTSVSSIYRLIKHGGAKRVLYLVDRANLGRQAKAEFDKYVTPDDGRKFTELYNVQHLTSNRIDPVARVCITTIQRLYSMLKGDEELDPELEEGSIFDSMSALVKEPVPVTYNPDVPIETFDFIFTDECHRSIYNLWRQVLEYFDAYLIGLTATPSKQTFAFFNQNLVMEYGYDKAVADSVNVDHDVYKIRTQITRRGSRIDAGLVVDFRDRATRAVRWEQLDEDFEYPGSVLDREVVAVDQIRTIIETFKDKLPEIFPGRTAVPKTLIYAKDDSHADDIVKIVREEFGGGNDFAWKITYKTTGRKPEDLLQQFRNSYNPRIVVTVDMIATGTDIPPLEIVMFMRPVRSRIFYEQMKGRGVRVIDDTEFRAVTSDATQKTRFVLIDCVGVSEQELQDAPPLERKPTVAFEKLLDAVAFGTLDQEILSSVASRLARLDRQLGSPDREALKAAAGGLTLREIVAGLVDALDPDRQLELAREANALPPDAEPTPLQLGYAQAQLLKAAAAPLATNPGLRAQILDMKHRYEQTIDTISKDQVQEASFSEQAREKARSLTGSFEEFIREHKDEITALQVLYSRPYRQRLRFADIKALAQAIQAPPRGWTTEELWRAYETLERSRVRRSGGKVLTDIVSLVRFALKQEDELVPFPDQVRERFDGWLAMQEIAGRTFTDEQRQWLVLIRDHVAASFAIEMEDFELNPFAQRGGAGRAYQIFGTELAPLLEELNGQLVA